MKKTKSNLLAWLRKKPKPRFMASQETKSPQPTKETNPMSAEILKSPVNRAVDAYRKLQTAHANAAAVILDQDAKIAADAAIIAELKAILDAEFPETPGGSTGNM